MIFQLLKILTKKIIKVIVVGGGAAGFFAAIACATNNDNAQVTILEAGRKPLAKVRISGGGRCNVTHHCFDTSELVQNYPRGGKALRGAFSRFQPRDTVAWFKTRGVQLKTEADGRMFPVTDDSETIVRCLLHTAQQVGVELRTGVAVQEIEKEAGSVGFLVILKTGEVERCDSLIIATGSNPLGYRWAKNLGHKVEFPVPSLFTFNIRDSRLQDLAGVTVDKVSVQLVTPEGRKLQQTGPLLITHWGVSGPAILKLSAWGARLLYESGYQFPLVINWLPEYNVDSLYQFLLAIKAEFPRKQVSSYCPLSLPKRLWQRLVMTVGIETQTPWTELSKKALNLLVRELVQGQYQIQGKGVFKEEFVTCGGISLQEVNFKTMESKCCPGLYFAGEVLDIDGVTGGFNFQSAWTTGWLAGHGIHL
jgi:predicted Rossmann fold flavoprotein